MNPIYEKKFHIDRIHTDRFGHLKPSSILYFVQEAAGEHCQLLNVGADRLPGLFWAIIRHRVQILRLPEKGETITLQTWPMPTTRTAFPRSVVAFDTQGRELFRSVSLWVLMDPNTRAMVVPGKSGVQVQGILRGNELAVPGSLVPGNLGDLHSRSVCFTDLDENGHMNNTRYLDWICDLLPSAFHSQHFPREITLCYLSEAREGDLLQLSWQLDRQGKLQVDALRAEDGSTHRIFSVMMEY